MSTLEGALGLQKTEHLAPSLEPYAASYEQWLLQQISKETLPYKALAPVEHRALVSFCGTSPLG